MSLGKIQLRVVAELVKLGMLTPAQEVNLGLRPDDLSGAALDVLLEAEFRVDRVSLGVAWSRALGIAFCDVTGHRVTSLLFEFIAENFCEDYLVLPVGQIGKALLVAVANPLAASRREMLEVMTGRRIVLLLALEKDLRLIFAQRRARHSGHAANFPASSWAGVTLPRVGAEEVRVLAGEANSTLAVELYARKWASAEILEVAWRMGQERATGGQALADCLLGILTKKMQALDESAILLQQMEADGIGLVDLGTCVVPAEMVPQLDLEVCRATCSVPFGRAGKFTMLASAYHLSSAVRTFWEGRLGGKVLWYGATLAGLADFLALCAAVRAAERDAPGTVHPATDRAVQTDPLDSVVIPIPAELRVPTEPASGS